MSHFDSLTDPVERASFLNLANTPGLRRPTFAELAESARNHGKDVLDCAHHLSDEEWHRLEVLAARYEKAKPRPWRRSRS